MPLSKLRTLIQQISPDADITPEDYINMDSDVPTEATMDLDDIIASITDSVESDVDPQWLMTTMEDRPSHQDLLTGILDNVHHFDQTMSQKRSQSSITNFFKPV